MVEWESDLSLRRQTGQRVWPERYMVSLIAQRTKGSSREPSCTHGTNLGMMLVRKKVKQWKREKVAKGMMVTTGCQRAELGR